MSPSAHGTPRTRWLADLIERRAGLIGLVTLAFAIVAGLGAAQLRVDQRLRKLLPDHFPSVAGMDRVAERLGNQSDIHVSIESPSREANTAFGEALAADLQGHPDLQWTLFRRDYAFFERHALLYASVDDLLDLRRRVIDTIYEQTRSAAYGDLSLLDDDDQASDDTTALGLSEDEIRRRYGLDQGPPEYFEAAEGRLMVLQARPVEESSNLDFARMLQADLEERIDALEPARFHPDMKIGLHGSFVQHGERVKQLQGEVVGGTAAALAALLLSIAVYFRSARAVALVLGPLLVAGVGALAFAWLVYDVLNLVSAFIFAVLLGLGIDFAIHVLARLRDEQARGHPRPTALAITLATTGRSTLAGGIGTGLAFSALTIADFQGFAQFGVIASAGLVLALVSALVVMPAMLVLSERVRPWPPPRPRAEPGSAAELGRPLMLAVTLLALVGMGVAGWAVLHASALEFEYDFRAMGPRSESEVEPEPPAAERPVTYSDAIGHAQTVAPAIALTDDRQQARDLFRQLSALQVMLPEEALTLTPVPASREPSLTEAVSAEGIDRKAEAEAEARARIEAKAAGSMSPAEPDHAPPPPPAHPAAIGDDWDADPEDWADPNANAPTPSEPEPEPTAAVGDDWDADPEDWTTPNAPTPSEPTAAGDDWDADPEDWADPESADAALTLADADPRILEIARAERARTLPVPEILAQLRVYDPERRADMSDRLRAVTGIDAFVPRQQSVKLELIADIRARIDAKRHLMPATTQRDIDAWYPQLTVDRPVNADALPPWVRQQFTDAQGEVGRFIVIRTGGSKADYLNSRRIYDAFATLHTPSGDVPVAAEFFVLPEVFEAIEADGPRVLLLAGMAMLLTAAVAFRGVAGVAAVTLVVASTLAWLLALMLALGWKLNFFNVIVLPLLIGMAQDDALHIYQRWRELGPGRLGTVLRETGGAVFLTTLTTACGFSGILFANHRGLQSMAWAAVAGMILALVAAIVLLPAALWVAEGLASRRRGAHDEASSPASRED